MSEFSPCPFCGSPATEEDSPDIGGIFCSNEQTCLVRPSIDCYGGIKPEHREAWNRRHNPRADRLDALLGDIFAILRINLLRETIKTTDNAEFERIIEGWHKQREEA